MCCQAAISDRLGLTSTLWLLYCTCVLLKMQWPALSGLPVPAHGWFSPHYKKDLQHAEFGTYLHRCVHVTVSLIMYVLNWHAHHMCYTTGVATTGLNVFEIIICTTDIKR